MDMIVEVLKSGKSKKKPHRLKNADTAENHKKIGTFVLFLMVLFMNNFAGYSRLEQRSAHRQLPVP